MDKRTIKRGMTALAAADPDVAEALADLGLPAPRLRPPGFETFLSTIISQQISTHAAAAIRGRVALLLPEPSPAALLALDDGALRGAGMSGRKIEYARGLALAIEAGEFDVGALAGMDDAEAIAAISSIRGFGRWSAEIYLMFSLRRKDIFPADDLALLVALGRLKGADTRPTPARARALVEHWAPWRSVGALFLWHYYRGAPE